MKWISVKDRLPEKRNLYLCYCASERRIRIIYSGRIDDDSFKPTHVSHWMPLPEKPKDVESNNFFSGSTKWSDKDADVMGDINKAVGLANYIKDKFESFGFKIGEYIIKFSDIDRIETNKEGTVTAFLKKISPGDIKIDFSWNDKGLQ